MDQLALLLTPEEQAYEIIKPALEEALRYNGLDESYLSLQCRKNYHSVLFDRSTVVARISSKPTPSLSVPTSLLLSSQDYSSMVSSRQSDYSKISMLELSNITEYTFMLQAVLQGIIDRIPKEYDCCSRYMECSNAKACIHPDKKFALKCGYRKNLNSGKIFYGKNRSIP